MNNNDHSTHHITKNQALFLGAFLIILFFTVIGAGVVFTAKTARIFEIKLTHLVLKSDACNFLRVNGVDTKAMELGSGCSAILPFERNVIGSGGLITMEDKQISIADDQVVVIGTAEEQPWTPAKTHAVITMIISTIVDGMMVWIFILILRKAAN